ncbi:hypothetical protein BLS_003103 [Venturia inaequalis]|uniref:Uncharacterized protein n=1 Tax=Venturia inaequalis TaxID=5025 RepID=A0A8H3USE5_VENIN|nr:hypothetical protein EG327_010491 [Venturia inaequalis]KAE9974496.1 hypothetical protein BLS_003103 [Venturia inaequalis]RDI87609.1 hypothetical protein Vi05172_g2334 [Venturia inaequalis]
MSTKPKPALTKDQCKTLLHTLTFTTPQALLNTIHKHAAKSPPSTTERKILQASMYGNHLLIFWNEKNMIPNALALDSTNRAVQVTSAHETTSARQYETDDQAFEALLTHPGVVNLLTTLREHVTDLIDELKARGMKEPKRDFEG